MFVNSAPDWLTICFVSAFNNNNSKSGKYFRVKNGLSKFLPNGVDHLLPMSRMKELENLNEIFAVEKNDQNGNKLVLFGSKKSMKMSKKFTFKHPAGASPAAVPMSSSSSSASMMSVASVPSIVNMQDEDDLWLDDIDEDMLVQASQMVEAANATHDDRMEIDAETLNKFIHEESKSDDLWNEAASNPFQKQKYAQQTQTVFQTVSQTT